MRKALPVLLLIVVSLTSCNLVPESLLNQLAPPVEPTVTPAPTPTATLIPSPTVDPNITPTPVPTLGLGSTRIADADGMTQHYIPAGEFMMGSNSFDSDEGPVHAVYLNAYWMDETEVTCGQFMRFVEQTGYKKSDSFVGYATNQCQKGENHPARASWDAAQAYCQWAGRRLPSEAEWEKAARGGLEGKEYPWGDEEPVCVWGAQTGAMFYDGENCFVSGTVPVKSYHPNGFGLYDMAGNASEWVFDYYHEHYYDPEYKDSTPKENPRGPAEGIFRVHRGGSYRSDSSSLRVSSREGMPPNNYFGFRCAQDAP